MLTPADIAATRQSLWLDNLRRDLILDGTIARMKDFRAVSGLTSNPSIFEKALALDCYAGPLRALAAAGASAEKIFETLAVEDIQRAADIFKPVYEASGCLDGFVSMEVSPRLARNAAATEAEGLRLFEKIGRRNLMIKVPATAEGLSAGEALLKKGVSVNFTLIFSVERYRAVTQAYTGAMSWRSRNRLPLEGVVSVASFFVSRIDSAVDAALKARPDGAPKELLGRAAIANSVLAYELYRELFYTKPYMASGMPPQRILWASTSVKDPAYRPSLYMEELALEGSVNTAPEDALEAYFAAGRINKEPLADRAAAARTYFAGLAKAGVDFKRLLLELEADGIAKFARSYDGILALMEAARRAAPAQKPAAPPAPPDLADSEAEAWLSAALKTAAGAGTLEEALARSVSSGVQLVSCLPDAPGVEAAVENFRASLPGNAGKCPLARGTGALRSSGEIRRRGPGRPLVLILTAGAEKDIVASGEKYIFWQLETAQAIGDFEAMDLRNRRVLRLHLKHPLDKSLALLGERIARVGKAGVTGKALQAEESEMLKLAVKKNNKTNSTKPATKIVDTNEYVVVDYPKNLESVTTRQYSVRIGASDCTGVDISVNDQPWQPCRHAVGYWWFDWNNFQPGTHQLVARMHKRNGEYLISKRRRCKAL